MTEMPEPPKSCVIRVPRTISDIQKELHSHGCRLGLPMAGEGVPVLLGDNGSIELSRSQLHGIIAGDVTIPDLLSSVDPKHSLTRRY